VLHAKLSQCQEIHVLLSISQLLIELINNKKQQAMSFEEALFH